MADFGEADARLSRERKMQEVKENIHVPSNKPLAAYMAPTSYHKGVYRIKVGAIPMKSAI